MSTIEWHQAQELPEENRKKQEAKIQEFLESSCEMFNGRDLQYYADETGKDLEWIINNGKNIHEVIKETYRITGSVDDVWNFDPINYTNEDCWDEDDSDDETSVDWHPDQHTLNLFKSIVNK